MLLTEKSSVCPSGLFPFIFCNHLLKDRYIRNRCKKQHARPYFNCIIPKYLINRFLIIINSFCNFN